MSFQVEIRDAKAEDLAAISDLWKVLMDFHKNLHPRFTRSTDGHKIFAEFVRSHLSSKDSCVLVAESNGRVVSYCLTTISSYPPVFEAKQYGTILDLVVDAAFRRCGIGQRMVESAQDWFSGKAIRRIEVRVAVANEVSTRFWQKMGFEPYVETVVKEI